MHGLGFKVPRGFVVTTQAYRHGVERMLQETSSLADLSAQIAARQLPRELEAAVVAAYERLGAGANVAVAVRSSASDEDGRQSSFAGQQRTCLNVRGHAALIDALREVWASLVSVESLLYRGRVQLDAQPPEMAVIVQELVDAEVAGVLFTRNPVNGDADEALICSAYGLGETVVGGQDTDTFYIDRKSGELRSDIACKLNALHPTPDNGLQRLAVDTAAQDAPSLSVPAIHRLLEVGQSLERAIGRPQDIEFAFTGGDQPTLFLLQTRPITGASRRSSTGHSAALYSNANVGEALPGVGTPMTWSIAGAFAARGFATAFGALGLDVPKDYSLMASFRGRIYLNISEFVSVASQIPILHGATLAQLGGVLGDLQGLDDTYTRLSPATFLRRLPLTLPRLAASQLSMPLIGKLWARKFGRKRDAFFAKPLARLSRAELQQQLEELDALFNRTGEVMLASAANFLMSYVLMSESLRRMGGAAAAEKEHVLFSGLTGVKSAAPGLELLALARFVKQSPSLHELFLDERDHPHTSDDLLAQLRLTSDGQVFIGKLHGFLRRWGHRALREAEIATPRWREDPLFLIKVIGEHLRAPYLPTPEAIEAEAALHRAEATQLIRQHFFTGVGAAFRLLLHWAHRNARLREELRSYVVETLSMYRTFYLEVGRRMVLAGLLKQVDDVFFLNTSEARDWLRSRDEDCHLLTTVAFRRAAFDAFVRCPDPPDTFTLVHDQEVSDENTLGADGDTLTGLPGSPGRVTGRARVFREPSADDISVQPGEILVAPFTDVGWTPLFLVAAGVVTDRGGPLSHSCVVAREYGIPAVVGVHNATQRIHTGDLVTIDGQAGVVHISREPSEPPREAES